MNALNILRYALLLSTLISTPWQYASAQDQMPSLNTFGSPGLVDMPTAHQMPNGTLSATISYSADVVKSSLNFQITPRLSGLFRYTRSKDIRTSNNSGVIPALYDRSLDLRYQLAFEKRHLPAITLGFQDLAGTGRFNGEYIVATKNISPRLRLTSGIGWGRLAERGGFSNPLGILSDKFDTRPERRETENGNGRPQSGLCLLRQNISWVIRNITYGINRLYFLG